MNQRNATCLLKGLALLCAAALAACAGMTAKRLPAAHPEKVTEAVCSTCHDKGGALAFASFDHRGDWLTAHRLRGQENADVCALCHAPSYCADCHAAPVEMTPSLRRQSETQRDMPHRGDYLSRHRIDARIDPTSCYRCHGNPRASKSCAGCHGK